MKTRIDTEFVLVFTLVAFSTCSGFYLPGLAPVSFCEDVKGGDDCQVNLTIVFFYGLTWSHVVISL